MIPADTNSPPRYSRAMIWLGISAIIFLTYWLCLRYLFPGYYAPVSAFHGDFYEYASLRDKSLQQILKYPRPAAYYAMKALGLGGLTWVMANGIVVALANVWLTVFLIRKVSQGRLSLLLFTTALYAILLFAHPDFYFEHRHDLPAEVSYFFAILSLVCWQSFVHGRRRSTRILLLCAAAGTAVLFVFAKETYFVSVPCLVAGMAWCDRKHGKWHAVFLCALLGLETISFLWTAHLNGPFVNTNSSPDATYHIDLAPAVLAKTAWFYFSRFLNPYLLLMAAWWLYLLRTSKHLLGLAVALIVAGMAALAPHAMLPNHLLEEYAWVGAPLLFAPLLLPGAALLRPLAHAGVTALLALLSIFAPGGYRTGYRSPELTFNVQQDRLGRQLARSVRKLHEIPPGSRVLVVGLDATYIPFYTESFMLTEFGEQTSWTLLTGPEIPERRSNRVTQLIGLQDVHLDSFNQLASYDAEGKLQSIREIDRISPAEQQRPDLLVPELKPYADLTVRFPHEGYRYLLAANVCLQWGLWREAKMYLDGAAANGSGADAAYRQLAARLAAARSKGLVE